MSGQPAADTHAGLGDLQTASADRRAGEPDRKGGLLEPHAGLADPQAWVAERLAASGVSHDPVARRSIDALARRAAAQQGEARRLMLQRLDQWLAKGGAAAAVAPTPRTTAGEVPAGSTTLAALATLVDRLGRSPSASGMAMATSDASGHSHPAQALQAGGFTQRSGPAASVHAGRPAQRRQPSPLSTPRPTPLPTPPTGLKSVTAFKATWARLRTEQRLRQALNQVPAQAGPLNSSQLVHRALHTLQALSPAYLTAFMAHVDALLWLDQASGAGLPEPKARPGAAAVKSPPPARPATARRPARKRSPPG